MCPSGSLLRAQTRGSAENLRRSARKISAGRCDSLARRISLSSHLQRLTPRHRRVLELRDIEGEPYAHVAATMNVSVAAVETLILRARRALRAELDRLDEALVGLPVLGGAWRRLRARAARVADWVETSRWLPVEAAGAAGATLVVAVALAIGGHSGTPARPLR